MLYMCVNNSWKVWKIDSVLLYVVFGNVKIDDRL